ncbi:DUF808 domain-containing protein [Raineyella sp.]|nr:DUF808 domain-containing protein [Raineyella sp.]MEA5154999.1 DUF808 domain-containing protein [Raineyella sp.]
MAGGLAALLDDVAMIAKAASATTTKAMGVVVDDAAVTPQYVAGIHPSRELPVIWRIARGSLVNKAILIVLLLVLDHFLPVVLTPLLMLGGLYLSFEGAEKLLDAVRGGGHRMPEEPGQGGPAVDRGAAEERTLVNGAVRTDFILSAEIMVISLATVNAGRSSSMALLPKTLILVLVAVTLTAVVYGAVALIVKMDDIGLVLEGRERRGSRRVGAALVAAMPVVLSVLSTVGIAAMLWVGGHILVTGANTLGWHAPADLLHHLAAPAHEVPGVGGLLAWLIDTLGSAVVAIVLGGLLVGITHLVPSRRHDGHRSA